MTRFLVFLVLSLALVTGCAKRSFESAKAVATGAMPAEDAEPRAEKADAEAKGPRQPRKIEYSAEIRLITEQFEETVAKIRTLVSTYKKDQGYIAQDDTRSHGRGGRIANWTIRIPIDQFEAFRAELLKTGEVEQDTLRTQDRTEEYYDKEARIKNLQAQLEGLREIYKRVADKVEKTENLLAVDQKIRDVTEDLERTQGRLKLLENLTSLTTVSLQLRERQKYVPDKGPNPVEVPTFGKRVRHTFVESGESLVELGQGLALVAVALTPWLPFVLLSVWLVRVLWRRGYFSAKSAEPIAAPGADAGNSPPS